MIKQNRDRDQSMCLNFFIFGLKNSIWIFLLNRNRVFRKNKNGIRRGREWIENEKGEYG